MHVPRVNIVTFEPTIEHTDGVDVDKATVRPEVAVALNTTGVELNDCAPGLENAMVWLA